MGLKVNLEELKEELLNFHEEKYPRIDINKMCQKLGVEFETIVRYVHTTGIQRIAFIIQDAEFWDIQRFQPSDVDISE